MAEESASPLIDAARRWLAAEPDDDMRVELAALIDAAERGEVDELAERFAAWDILRHEISDFPAPAGQLKRFATIVARKPA